MMNKLKIPQKYEDAYQRLIERVPVAFQHDLSVQQMILETLKSKGEEFVSLKIDHAIEEYKQQTG
jgi:hypothetical protein